MMDGVKKITVSKISDKIYRVWRHVPAKGRTYVMGKDVWVDNGVILPPKSIFDELNDREREAVNKFINGNRTKEEAL